MALVDYKIVIPSRKRTHLMERCLSLFPTASICVDEREEDDYRAVVPEEKLVLHPPNETFGELRQWILDNYRETCIVMIDDDVHCFVFVVGQRTRRTRCGWTILQIIENQINIAVDLGLEMFTLGKDANPLHFSPSRPIILRGMPQGFMGFIGRRHRFDVNLQSGVDGDMTMRHMLTSRVVMSDNRIVPDHGLVGVGAGGLQGTRTADNWRKSREVLAKRWGGYLNMGKNTERKVSSAFGNNVPRQAPSGRGQR